MVQQCACDCKIENCMTNIIEKKIIFKLIEYREKNKTTIIDDGNSSSRENIYQQNEKNVRTNSELSNRF